MKKNIRLFVFVACYILPAHALRNAHRPPDPHPPLVKVSYENDNNTKRVWIDHAIRAVPLLRLYDDKYFMAHLLPDGPIHYLDGSGKVDGRVLKSLIQDLLDAIYKHALTYSNFEILKASNFVRRQCCGLLVVKFKDYPFVLKLFIETPESFVNPYKKGFEMRSAFVCGGSVRHILGFTRIKTLEHARETIAQNPRWRDRVTFPRKWNWLPEQPTYLRLSTRNLGVERKYHVRIPAIYAIIADKITPTENVTLDRNELMALSRDLDHRIDPHTHNFMPYKDRIVVIDTELFPFIMGYYKRIQPTDDHITWYLSMARKYLKEKFATAKTERFERRQKNLSHYYLD